MTAHFNATSDRLIVMRGSGEWSALYDKTTGELIAYGDHDVVAEKIYELFGIDLEWTDDFVEHYEYEVPGRQGRLGPIAPKTRTGERAFKTLKEMLDHVQRLKIADARIAEAERVLAELKAARK